MKWVIDQDEMNNPNHLCYGILPLFYLDVHHGFLSYQSAASVLIASKCHEKATPRRINPQV